MSIIYIVHEARVIMREEKRERRERERVNGRKRRECSKRKRRSDCGE